MKIKIQSFLFLVFFTIFFAGCNGQTKTKEKNQPRSDKQPSVKSNINIQVPDFNDAAINQYYKTFTNYIKKAVTAVRNKDEAAWNGLVEESKQFGGEEEAGIWAKAKSTPEGKQKAEAWEKQAMPYLAEIIQSDYNKKLEQEQGKQK
jgi:hypothetical protein